MSEKDNEHGISAAQLLRTNEALRFAHRAHIHAHHRLGDHMGVDLLGPLGAAVAAMNANKHRTAKRIIGDLIAMLIAGRIDMAEEVVLEMQYRDSRPDMHSAVNRILREAAKSDQA